MATFYIQLLTDREGNTIVFLTKRSNFLCTTRLLFHELVTRTADDDKLIGKLFLQLLKLSILGSVATFRGRVYDEYFLAFVLGEVKILRAIQRFQGDVVDTFRCSTTLCRIDGFGFTEYTSGNKGANGCSNGSDTDDSHNNTTKVSQLGLIKSW